MSGAAFCVTLLGSTPAESDDLERALRRAAGSLPLEMKCQTSAADASFPLEIIHAIVFTPISLARATTADLESIKLATKPGTCRVYLLVPGDSMPPVGTSPLDDFIQRTSTHDTDATADQIVAFFREADDLNQRSTIMGLRDLTCLSAYQVLKFMWPCSYVFVAAHILNAGWILAGHSPWPLILAIPYVIPAGSFFGAFFIVHYLYVSVRNTLFGMLIHKRLNFGFALNAGALGVAAAATAFSIVSVDESKFRIIMMLALATSAYLFYLYARRVRAECTSLSSLQAAMADSQRRTEVFDTVGRHPPNSSAYPFFPYRSNSLFISYMHGSEWSSNTATLIHRWAAEYGFNVFLDRSSIASGSLWRQHLLRGLSECEWLIAVLDGEAPVTEWVLAESAYAALLRKSIGKPRILIVVQNAVALSKLEQSPFGLLYMDLFAQRLRRSPGAAILMADEAELSAQLVLQAMERVEPMSLLRSKDHVRRHFEDDGDVRVPSARDSVRDDEADVADRAWRTSILLFKLFEGAGATRLGVDLLLRKSMEWLRSSSSIKRAIALNILRGLIKEQHLSHSHDILDMVLNALNSDTSLAVKLAALDLLGAISTTTIPRLHISSVEKKKILEFRSNLMNRMNSSQRAYAVNGVRADIERELSGKSHWAAIMNLISSVDSAG